MDFGSGESQMWDLHAATSRSAQPDNSAQALQWIEVQFDENQISYQKLLDIFFKIHNPTLLNRQGLDVGSQYRSAIFYKDESQKKLAEEKIAALNAKKIFNQPIVTEISPLQTFYKAFTPFLYTEV